MKIVKETQNFPIRAGMRMENGKVTDYAIRDVGTKKVEFTYYLHDDGDKQLISHREVSRKFFPP
jgi:hypothetical protein